MLLALWSGGLVDSRKRLLLEETAATCGTHSTGKPRRSRNISI